MKAGNPEHLISKGGECIRLFQSNGDSGCRSASHDDIAPLYPIQTLSQFDILTVTSHKLSLVLKEPLFINISSLPISSLNQIAGVYILPASSNHSFDARSPQGKGTIDQELNIFSAEAYEWNAHGSDLLERSYSFPVVIVTDAAVASQIMDRALWNYEKHGVQEHTTLFSEPLYKSYFHYYFGPPLMDSIKCLQFKNIEGKRAPRCDPLGGQSIWGYKSTVNGGLSTSLSGDGEFIMVMAGMDATSFSHVTAHGANTAISGIVTLLAAAYALNGIPDEQLIRPIVFAAFQSEKFGFVGSRRFLKDIQLFQKAAEADRNKAFAACKAPIFGSNSMVNSDFCADPLHLNMEFAHLNISKLKYAIAVDQVGILQSDKYYIHANPLANEDSDSSWTDVFTQVPAAGKDKVDYSRVTNSLPPTPLLSFLNDNEYGRSTLKSAVFAGYNTNFIRDTYNSQHDVVERISIAAVTNAAEILAQSLYVLAANPSDTTSRRVLSIQINQDLVQELISCIAQDWACDLMLQYSDQFVSTMIEYLDLTATARPTYQDPVTLYPGPIDINRQSLLIKANGQQLYTFLRKDEWNDDTFRTRIFPNAYEVFIRSFFAAVLSPKKSADANSDHCGRTQTCAKDQECVYPGRCRRRAAFFHDALSPNLIRTMDVGVYDIWNSSKSIWTEPQWDENIGNYIFPDPGRWIGWFALICGMIVTVAGYVGSKYCALSIQKMKLY